MKIDLTGLFNGSAERIDIDYSIDSSLISIEQLDNNIKAVGCLYSKADVVYLDLKISYSVNGVCDRCAEDVSRDFNIDIKRIIVEQLQNEDDDDYIIVTNRELDLDELINEEVVLSYPSKLLCSEDCKGLCSMCGTNLNYKKCDCKKEVDPRMSALLQLLDED